MSWLHNNSPVTRGGGCNAVYHSRKEDGAGVVVRSPMTSGEGGLRRKGGDTRLSDCGGDAPWR